MKKIITALFSARGEAEKTIQQLHKDMGSMQQKYLTYIKQLKER